ncbi:MAG: hypothetical protein ACQEP8_00525 [Chlamydiota bacterium]
MKTGKQSLALFIGIGLMLFLTYYNYICLTGLREAALRNAPHSPSMEQLRLLTPLATLVVGLLLILITLKGHVERAFHFFFPLNFLAFGVISFMVYFHSSFIETQSFTTFLYLWSGMAVALPIIIAWGYANHHNTFKTASLQYPLFSWALLLALLTPPEVIINQLGSYPWLSYLAIAFMSLLIYGVFLILKRQDLGIPEAGLKVSVGYWVALVMIVIGYFFAQTFSENLLFTQVKSLISTIPNYQHQASHIALVQVITLGILSIAGIIAGGVLYCLGPKAYGKTGITLLILSLLPGLALFANSWHLEGVQSLRFSTISWAISSAFALIFLITIKELAFFAIRRKSRFSVKLAVDFIIYSIAPVTAGQLIDIYIRHTNNTLNSLTIIYSAYFVIGMILCFLGVIKIHNHWNRRLQEALPVPTPTPFEAAEIPREGLDDFQGDLDTAETSEELSDFRYQDFEEDNDQ